MNYTVIIKPATNGGFCPDFVLNNETIVQPCNTDPCGKICFISDIRKGYRLTELKKLPWPRCIVCNK